jgi:hypothetical protein
MRRFLGLVAIVTSLAVAGFAQAYPTPKSGGKRYSSPVRRTTRAPVVKKAGAPKLKTGGYLPRKTASVRLPVKQQRYVRPATRVKPGPVKTTRLPYLSFGSTRLALPRSFKGWSRRSWNRSHRCWVFFSPACGRWYFYHRRAGCYLPCESRRHTRVWICISRNSRIGRKTDWRAPQSLPSLPPPRAAPATPARAGHPAIDVAAGKRSKLEYSSISEVPAGEEPCPFLCY